MHTPTPSIVAGSLAFTVQACPVGHAGRSDRPHAFGGNPPATSSHRPWTQAVVRSAAHVSAPGHDGLAGHARLASNAAAWLCGTAVSLPPPAQPQQSARTRAQSLAAVHAAPLTAAHAHVRQPAASTANPSAQLAGHAIGKHASTHAPA
jgi:hypothetical protein